MREASRLRAKPVFVDRSGRRRRFVKLTGAVLGGLLVVALGLLGAAVSGASPLRMPGFPDADDNAEGGHTTPAATPSTAPTPQPRPRPTSGPADRPDQTSAAVTITTSAGATKPGRDPTHPAHPTPAKSK